MFIKRMKASGIRNISELSLEPSPNVNFIFGENGSGKTSLLEAIYLLGHSKSFRHRLTQSIIQHGQDEFTLFAELSNGMTIGLQKSNEKNTQLKLGGVLQNNALQLAQELPILLINPETFQLLTAGPKKRREFLDWGVFHVKHSFAQYWQQAKQVLKQRNMAIRARLPLQQIQIWNAPLATAANQMDQLRKEYIDYFIETFQTLSPKLLKESISISYYRGWKADTDLWDVLQKNTSSDMECGYTQAGPQRADLRIKVDDRIAQDVLSRGQQKLLVCAMVLSQGTALLKLREKHCVYLVDDLPSELDEKNRMKILHHLMGLPNQLFLTSVEKSSFEVKPAVLHRMFHVKHPPFHLE